MPYIECDECDNEIYYDTKEELKQDKYFDVINKAYNRLMVLYRLHVQELSRAPSEQDPQQIKVLEAQINILKYIIGVYDKNE
jgi:hypothetical protein